MRKVLPAICQLAFREGWRVFCPEGVHRFHLPTLPPPPRKDTLHFLLKSCLSSWLRGIAENEEGVGARFCSPGNDARCVFSAFLYCQETVSLLKFLPGGYID